MKLIRVIAALTGIAFLVAAIACSTTPPAEVAPTPDIDATVEAKIGVALAKIPTVTPMPTPTPVPTATSSPSPTATPNIQATVEAQVLDLITAFQRATPYPTYTPIPTPTLIPIPAPTLTPTPFPTVRPTPRPTARPTIRGRVGRKLSIGGAAVTLHEVKSHGRKIVRVEFTIENTGYVEFTYNSLDTSIQTSDGMQYTYDYDAYTDAMHTQVWLPSISYGGVLRRSEGFMIPRVGFDNGSHVTKFIFEHPDRNHQDFIFIVE